MDRFQLFSKNRPISKVFREIGLADELGSGMRNTNKYTKLYSGRTPTFDEGDIFKITIPLKSIATGKVAPDSVSVVQDVAQDENDLQKLIIKLICENNRVTRQQIAKAASVSEKTVERQIKKMHNIRFVGKGNSGHWEINKGYLRI